MVRIHVQALFIPKLLTKMQGLLPATQNELSISQGESRLSESQPPITNFSPMISSDQKEQFPFDAQEMVTIYQKRFGTPPPPKAIEAMAHWNLSNAERAQVLYDINQLVRLLMDQLKQKVALQESQAP